MCSSVTSPKPVASTLNLHDAKYHNLTGATVQIMAGYLTDKDRLSFVNTGHISGAWNAITGTLTLSGTDTISHYCEALRTIALLTTRVSTTSSTRTLTILVSDTASTSSPATRSISVLKS